MPWLSSGLAEPLLHENPQRKLLLPTRWNVCTAKKPIDWNSLENGGMPLPKETKLEWAARLGFLKDLQEDDSVMDAFLNGL